ncbi:SymE family type I addiction module toxin [Chryseobacterium flavum]|uniref:SymE family type I addiction module toxin n=2 Tax=Chryseobacterium flavum TaxID=415851 RepID=UPI0028A967EA|nr:SymE family type I addiction module toxin [Chryseobacterium flavum]
MNKISFPKLEYSADYFVICWKLTDMRKRMNRSKDNELHNRNITVFLKSFSRAHGKTVFFPEIRITGKWVQQCGFQPGDHVLVTVCRNQIILEREEDYGDVT